MKKILLFIILTFLVLPCSAEQKINVYKSSNPEASKILYEFQLKEQKITPKKAFDLFNYNLSSVYAFFYDLDMDGTNEVIGIIDSNYFYCLQGYELFILKKDNMEYKNLSKVNFYPNMDIYILEHQTDGYFDLKVHHIITKLLSQDKNFLEQKELSSVLKYNNKEKCYKYFFPN